MKITGNIIQWLRIWTLETETAVQVSPMPFPGFGSNLTSLFPHYRLRNGNHNAHLMGEPDELVSGMNNTTPGMLGLPL